MSYEIELDGVPTIAQRSNKVCWATVYTMLKSWNDSTRYTCEEALATVGTIWVNQYKSNMLMLPHQVPTFTQQAGMKLESMQDIGFDGWADLLSNGPLWVGTMFDLGPSKELHSRVVKGLRGNGTGTGTYFSIVDPWGGRTYYEDSVTFAKKYDGAAEITGDEVYYQVRHF
jgi:hypothetical protein